MKEEMNLEKLAQMVANGFEDLRQELGGKIVALEGKVDSLEVKMEKGFAEVNHRLDTSFQPQLDDHARRIKKLEEELV